MKNISHITPRYFLNRMKTIIYEKKHPELPWLTIQANEILGTLLLATDIGVELGSGRSTVWLAKRVGQLISIEHNREWYDNVVNMLQSKNICNVDYRLAETEEGESQKSYYMQLNELMDCSLDFCLIDGVYRGECAEILIDKLKSGGVMVIDNVNRYLPSLTRSPSSIKVNENPPSDIWRDVRQELKTWRSIWTSTGVTDTAFFFKPSD